MKIIETKDYLREHNYQKFYGAAMPFFTITGTFDITNLIKYSKKYKLNAILCYCIQNAAQKVEGFHLDFLDRDHIKYFEYVCTNWIIENKKGTHSYISAPYEPDFFKYFENYLTLNKKHFESCDHHVIEDQALVATSAVLNATFDSYGMGYEDDFISPFIVWSRYKKRCFKYYLSCGLRFHHSMFDGREVGKFFTAFQQEINNFKVRKQK